MRATFIRTRICVISVKTNYYLPMKKNQINTFLIKTKIISSHRGPLSITRRTVTTPKDAEVTLSSVSKSTQSDDQLMAPRGMAPWTGGHRCCPNEPPADTEQGSQGRGSDQADWLQSQHSGVPVQPLRVWSKLASQSRRGRGQTSIPV